MNPWDMFCALCKVVVENKSVYLDVLITNAGIEMMLMPMDDSIDD